MADKRYGLISLRKKKDLTQQEAAKNIGISRTYLTELENGDKNPSLQTLIKLIDFYGDEVKDIFFSNEVA